MIRDFTQEPLAKHFNDLDLVTARSSWTDAQATAVAFLCGPYQGHRVMRRLSGDLGGAHVHPDTASLQVYSRGEFLLCDPGYEGFKRTDHHNTLLVGGHGQLGEGTAWYNVNRVLHFQGWAEVQAFRDERTWAAWLGDASRMYVREAKLSRFRRHVLYLRPDLLVVLDQLAAAEARVFTQLWHAESEWKALASGGWGFTQKGAAFSAWPLAVAQAGAGMTVEARRQELPDLLNAGGRSQYELRVSSPSAHAWVFAVVFAAGDAAGGPPSLECESVMSEIVVTKGPGAPVRIRFDLEGNKAPAVV